MMFNLESPPFSVSKKAFSFSWFSVLCPLLHCPPIRHKREGSIKEFSKDLSQLGTHIKNWLGDKDTHHCKIFWSRGGNKGYGGGEQLVEEEDREGQVQLQHHPQQVRQHTQPLTWRAGTWESPVWISTSARSVSTSVKITLQVFYPPPPCPSYLFCRQILSLLLTMSSRNKDVRGVVHVFQIHQRHRIEMLFWCSHYTCFTFLLKHEKMVSNDVRHPVCTKELIMIPIFCQHSLAVRQPFLAVCAAASIHFFQTKSKLLLLNFAGDLVDDTSIDWGHCASFYNRKW